MAIRVCVAGATGWTGSLVTRRILTSQEFQLAGALARKMAGQDIGEVLGLPKADITIVQTLEELLPSSIDVLVDYTGPASVKARTLNALESGIRVVIGTSGLTAVDYAEIGAKAQQRKLGVIAAGNFSLTAALAKHFALLAAKYLPSWEIIDYASAGKIDAPSGTVQELAEELGQRATNQREVPIEQTHGRPEARGAKIAGTPVHSLRLPSYTIAFETIFGLPDERLTIRHDSGAGAEPYINGTFLAVRQVMQVTGLVRGLDRLLFASEAS